MFALSSSLSLLGRGGKIDDDDESKKYKYYI